MRWTFGDGGKLCRRSMRQFLQIPRVSIALARFAKKNSPSSSKSSFSLADSQNSHCVGSAVFAKQFFWARVANKVLGYWRRGIMPWFFILCCSVLLFSLKGRKPRKLVKRQWLESCWRFMFPYGNGWMFFSDEESPQPVQS